MHLCIFHGEFWIRQKVILVHGAVQKLSIYTMKRDLTCSLEPAAMSVGSKVFS